MLTIKIMTYQNKIELVDVEISQGSRMRVCMSGTGAFDAANKEARNLKAVVCYVDTDGDFVESKILGNQVAYITDSGGNTVHVIQ